MASNYLKKYYLEDKKLAQRALLEFQRALSTGRMIAFTGAMATQAHGYGSWDQLKATFASLAIRTLSSLDDPSAKETYENTERFDPEKPFLFDDTKLKEEAERISGFFSSRLNSQVSMSLIEEVLDQLHIRQKRPNLRWPYFDKNGKYGATFWPLDQFDTPVEALGVALARWFRSPEYKWRMHRSLGGKTNSAEDFDVLWPLWNSLGIRRFATTSYDMELERTLMLSDKDHSAIDQAKADQNSAFEHLRKLREASDDETFFWDLGSGRIRRVMSDGWASESDVLNRERIDRLIEFAVGTDDVDGHIMHLHGRADDWRKMILSQRDYDALYRLNDLNRAPFDHARRMMMGGNPILFVGLGMGEADLNRELEEFISNSPYQRVAPIFLLWNASRDGMSVDEIKAKRLEFLHRLGVFTIFDNDLSAITPRATVRKTREEIEKDLRTRLSSTMQPSAGGGHRKEFDEIDELYVRQDLLDLAGTVKRLGELVNTQSASNPGWRENHTPMQWRSMKSVIERFWDDKKPSKMWNVSLGAKKPKSPNASDVTALINEMADHAAICVIGPQGCGKGHLSRGLVERIEKTKSGFPTVALPHARHAMLINGSFSFDTDSLLEGVSHFLEKTFSQKFRKANTPRTSRAKYFEDLMLSVPVSRQSKAMIVMNGMERFFGIDGRPLSAELEQLIKLVSEYDDIVPGSKPPQKKPNAAPKLRLVLFGTERVRAHMDNLGIKVVDFANIAKKAEAYRHKQRPPSFYLAAVAEKMEIRPKPRKAHFPDRALREAEESYKANAPGRISGDGIHLRKALFNAIFDAEVFSNALGKAKAPLAKELLRYLAFIGTPTEAAVLERLLSHKTQQWTLAQIENALKALVDLKLVLTATGFVDYPGGGADTRYVLHRSMLTELRYRFGIPLNEAKLSTAFNMSLYVAQPIDGDIPDSDIHDELGLGIDRLIGGYKRVFDGPSFPTEWTTEITRVTSLAAISKTDFESALNAAAEECADCQNDKANVDKRRARVHALCSPEHVQSLRAALALCRSYYSTTGLLTLDGRGEPTRDDSDGILLEHAERLDDLIDGFAKQALARAKMRAVAPALFPDVYGEAEPFYADELVWLHNERGVVRMAMGDLYEAKSSFDRAMKINREWVERDDRSHNWRRVRLNQLTVDLEMGELGLADRKIEEILGLSGERKEPAPSPLRPRGTNEDKLAFAIATGYRGWIRHLRGQLDEARTNYDAAARIFVELNEVRAQAYFARLRVSALDRTTSATDRLPEIEKALDLAQSARQMDIAHRLQITLADEYLFGRSSSPERQQRAYRLLDEAISYSLQTNVHRVRCEATAMLAAARFQTGDFDGALRFAMDAMMVATRYGLELRKIMMRAIIARIMVARGHPVTAEHLARTCIKMATRQRYQTAIDRAELVLVEVPKISDALSHSDRSGRRSY
jgi:tetratricopeptide (TPR) repeat protein